jgi:hypothetical protein
MIFNTQHYSHAQVLEKERLSAMAALLDFL